MLYTGDHIFADIIKSKKELNNQLKGKMFVLSPIRRNLTKELEALYHFFPPLTKEDDNIGNLCQQPSLRITKQQDFIMDTKDDFGPPRIRSSSNSHHQPTSNLHAYIIETNHLQPPHAPSHRLHTIEWCNVIDR